MLQQEGDALLAHAACSLGTNVELVLFGFLAVSQGLCLSVLELQQHAAETRDFFSFIA